MIKNYLLAFFLLTSSLVFGQVKVLEDFNVSMTPAGWTNSQNSGTLISRQTTANSYGRPGVVAAVRANNYNVASGNTARLESIVFTPTVSGDSMSIDVAHVAYPGSTDSLIIHTFDGTNFIRLIGWGSSQTLDTITGISVGPAQFGGFTPTSSQWCRKTLALPIGTSQIRFEFYSNFGNHIWLDRVLIATPAAPVVITETKSNITTSSVDLTGTIMTSFPAITSSGIVVSTSPNPTIGGLGVIDSTTNPVVTAGLFTKSIVGLSNSTTYFYRTYAVNSIGTSYGADSTFTTNSSAVIPTILSIVASNVNTTTATFGGNITSDGGSAITASGVVYNTVSSILTVGSSAIDSTTNPLVSLGTFSINPAGLAHSTKYYFKSYATNGIGTAYSAIDSFTTAPIYSVLPYTENFDGASTPWKSSAINFGTNAWELGTPTKTFLNSAFSAPNSFVTKLSGNYLGTEDCVVTSPQFDFSSATITPTISFTHKFDESNDIGWDGGVVEISINNGVWTRLDNVTGTGANFNSANSSAWYNDASGSGTLGANKFNNLSTAYSSQVNGWITSTTALTGAIGQSNVKVRFRFWADGITDEGWAIDNIEVKLPVLATVVTGTKANITTIGADLSGNITSNGNAIITSSGIVYSTSPAPIIGGLGVVDSTTNPLILSGNFTKAVSGLAVGTTYFYRAYVTNAVGTSYGADSTFTTNASAVIPTILSIVASNVNTTTATFGGNITSDGGSAITASGVVYNTVSSILTVGSSAIDSTTNPLVSLGTFSINPAGLAHSTKYYYKAYATNGIGTAYSAIDSFTTSPIVSVLPYNQNFDGVGNTGWTTASINARVNSWALGTPAKTFMNGAYSGANAYVTKLVGNYGSLGDEEAGLVSPQFDFTTSTSDPVLRFRNKHKTNNDPGWDCGVVEISINNGAWVRLNNQIGTGTNYNTLASYSWCNLNNASGFINSGNKFTNTTATYASQVNGWVESATRLTGAAGQSNVKIRFHFAADQFGTDEGWAIDDIQIENIVAPTAASTAVTLSAVTNTSATANWTNGNGQNRLVVARLNSSAAVAPLDSVLYKDNSILALGDSTGTGNFVVYNGTASSINVTGLALLTNYSFDVYEYNGRYMHNAFTTAATNNTITLPVKLVSFKIYKSNENVDLNWVTSSEINNKGFEVQRSLDGKLFKTIAFVKGAGNSNKNVAYNKTDENAFVINKVQKLYYRLNQIDFDGKTTLSNVKEVSANDIQSEIVKVYPNPFTNDLDIETYSTNNSTCLVQVIDISGRVLINQTVETIIGTNNIKVNNVSALSAGIYFVKITNNGTVNTMKVVKQ